MISPRKLDDYGVRKLLPTVNVLDPFSIKCWSMFRQISFDYGREFDLRGQSLVNILILVWFVGIVMKILHWFRIIVLS